MNLSSMKSVFLIALGAIAILLSGVMIHKTYAGQDMPESGIMPDESFVSPTRDEASRFEQGDHHQVMENDVYIKTEDGSIHRFDVELAVRGDEQEKGLMFRNSMPEDHGMLFVFRMIQQRSFWMKNTLIPLDIIFLEPDGRIQHIHHSATPQDLSFITSGQPCKAVLELNGGTADKLGIQVGDKVFHSAFRNLNLLHQ